MQQTVTAKLQILVNLSDKQIIMQRRENPLFQWWDESRKLVVYYL